MAENERRTDAARGVALALAFDPLRLQIWTRNLSGSSKPCRVVFTKAAQKDARKLNSAGLRPKAEALLAILQDDPFRNSPPYEKLVGNLSGAYSRRINIQHRLVYQILEQERTVKVLRMWTYYE